VVGDEWAKRDAAVVWHGFTQMGAYLDNSPIVVERGDGRELVDVDGRRYFDAISSLWVTTLGHRVPELDAALVEQAGRVAHSTMLGNGNRVVIELAEALADRVPVDGGHVLFASDGAAAVEQALKIAFQYWANIGVSGRTQYLALGGAYHGDTVGSLSLGDGGFGTDLFDPLRFPVLRTPGYDDPGWADAAVAMVEAHASSLAAVVLEPLVQGAAGMQVAAPDDVRRVCEAVQAAGVLLVCDEVATGFGRTGTLFAVEQCGVRPDLLCLGKGITGGYLPMSATVASQRVFDAFLGDDLGPRTLYHGHSYGGNALAAAVALRHLRLLDEWDVLANVRERSVQLRSLLESRLPGRVVRMCGLLAGIDVASGRHGRLVCAAAVRRGVLLRPLGNVIVLVPPLTTTADELERVVDVLAAALDEVGDA
jgi:adenosylmethionine-8-amino-7-oxononanoate aminotransferase